MKHRLCKIFIKNDNASKIDLIDYDTSINHDYYTFIKEQMNLGFQQFILTSDLIMSLMDYYVLSKNLRINSIEFMEEDQEINRITETLSDSKHINNYLKLKKELSFLSQNSSIEIKKINLINPLGNDLPISIFFQVNGIIGIDSKSYDEEKKVLSDIISNLVQGRQ